MKIEKKKLSELKPAPYNPRINIREDKYFYEKLYRSIEQFGLVEPIIWNKRTGHVVGGNQRLAILQDKGIEETEVIVVDLPLEEEKALNIALNKITGDWDWNKLQKILAELKDIDAFLVDLTGFYEDELDAILFDVDWGEEPDPEVRAEFLDLIKRGGT